MNMQQEGFRVFMERHRVKEKNRPFNLLGMEGVRGRFLIPDEEKQNFFDLYIQETFQKKRSLSIIETHKNFGPLVCDIDMKYEAEETEHLYTPAFLHDLLVKFMAVVDRYLLLTTDDQRLAFVMEKEKPTVKEGGLLKDGIHFIFPGIVTEPDVQYMIREDFIEETNEMFASFPVPLSNDIDDIIDRSVIFKNGWMLYGSSKPNCPPYTLTGIWEVTKFQARCTTMQEKKELYFNHRKLVELLSIQRPNVGDMVDLNEYGKSYFEYWKKNETRNLIKKAPPGKKVMVTEDLQFVRGLVDLLEPKRADSYQTWIEVGWCLFNIDYRLLDKWIDFSQKSSRYADTAEETCRDLWDGFTQQGLSIGTLHMWAKLDNPTFYQKHIRDSLEFLIRQCCNILSPPPAPAAKKGEGGGGGGGDDSKGATKRPVGWDDAAFYVVKVLRKLYSYIFVCSCYSQKIWWEYKNHRWTLSDRGVSLRQQISTDVYDIFIKVSMKYYTLANQLQGDDNNSKKENYLRLATNSHSIAEKLRNLKYRNTLLDECAEQFYWNSDESEEKQQNFEEILDSNINLVGLKNGVYDLTIHAMRPGRCEDYLSMSTLNEYVDYTPDSPEVMDVTRFVAQVLPNDNVREYVMTLLGSFLDGSTGNEKFYIWVGSGGNGKSKLIELFQLAMGEYCGNLPVTVITQNRPASNAASPEVARLKGKRFVSIQEPNEKEKLQVGRMKELTGGDTIYARSLHKEPIEFKPQFKMILCCNHLPKVPPDDGGAWRRLEVIFFDSKFVMDPDPDDPCQFAADLDLHQKLHKWKFAFFWLLTRYYKRFKVGDPEKGIAPGIRAPKEVLDVTNKYRNRNDIMSEFVQEHLVEESKNYISVLDTYAAYMAWCRLNGFAPLQRNDFQENMENRIGGICLKRKAWKGYRLIPPDEAGGGGDAEDRITEDHDPVLVIPSPAV